MTIKAVCMLWADLQESYNFKFLLARRLNQDPLENLFGIIRQQHSCNETANTFQFTAGLRHIIVGKLFKLSDGSNCQADKAVLLTELKKLRLDQESPTVADTFSSNLSDTEEPADVLESNIVCYVSGYLVQAFLKKAPCLQCKDLLKDKSQDLSSPNQISMMFKAVEMQDKTLGNLTVPTEAAFNFVRKLEEEFSVQIGAVAHLRGVSEKLLRIMMEVTNGPFCSAHCRKLFLQMFVLGVCEL